MAAKKLQVVVELSGTEPDRQLAYSNTLKFLLSKCVCEVRDEGSNISKSKYRGTGGEGLFPTGTEGRMH